METHFGFVWECMEMLMLVFLMSMIRQDAARLHAQLHAELGDHGRQWNCMDFGSQTEDLRVNVWRSFSSLYANVWDLNMDLAIWP